MLRYKAGYKYVNSGIHAQVLDFPAANTMGADLDEARRRWQWRWWTSRRRRWNRVNRFPFRIQPRQTRKWTLRSRFTCTWAPDMLIDPGAPPFESMLPEPIELLLTDRCASSATKRYIRYSVAKEASIFSG